MIFVEFRLGDPKIDNRTIITTEQILLLTVYILLFKAKALITNIFAKNSLTDFLFDFFKKLMSTIFIMQIMKKKRISNGIRTKKEKKLVRTDLYKRRNMKMN